MKKLYAIVVTLLATSVLADQSSFDYMKNIKSIEVVLEDDAADDACWTNLTETREYAEEKIRMAGGTLYVESEYSKRWKDDYDLHITVKSHRLSNEKCFGFVQVDLRTVARINEVLHTAIARGGYMYFTNSANANNQVIETLQIFF